jgi:hypothetical protein
MRSADIVLEEASGNASGKSITIWGKTWWLYIYIRPPTPLYEIEILGK